MNVSDQKKNLLEVPTFEATISVFITTDDNNSFPITTTGHWSSKVGEETIDKVNNLLELRSQRGIDLQVKEAEQRCLMMKKKISS